MNLNTGDKKVINNKSLQNNNNNGKNTNVKDHYNNLKGNMKPRTSSPAIKIRYANNFIKASLIGSYAKEGMSVLDLGCGRGGDLLKYRSAKISYYHGIDIADKSISDAKIRYNKRKWNFNATFEVYDAYNKEFNLNRKFNLISSQFSFHYAFKNEESLEISVNNIAKHLSEGGYFILTVPNKEKIMENCVEGKKSNKYYSVDLVLKDKDNGIRQQNEYFFTLIDSINQCIEYFIDFNTLVDKFKKHNIDFVKREGFLKYFIENKRQNNSLYELMKVETLDKQGFEVLNLYEIVVFQKQI